MKLYQLIISIGVSICTTSCVETYDTECERLIATHLNNPMCDQFDYYKSSGNGDLNSRGGYSDVKSIAIDNCRKARECEGVIESKYEEALWRKNQAQASPYLHQDADGKGKGNVVIEINKKIGNKTIDQSKSDQTGKELISGTTTVTNAILDGIRRHTDKLDTVFTVKVKQGTFIKTNSHQITFKLRDFLKAKGKIKLNYQTYDCHDTFVTDKEFETFLIEAGDIKLREFKAPFRCKGPYYTVKTVVEKTETQEPSMRTGGRTLDLKTVILNDSKQVVYIDPRKGKITNVPFVKETMVEKTSEKYKLNTLSCQYEIVKKDEELPYHKASFTYLNNFSSSTAFTKDTVLDLQISSIKNKVIKVPWNRLKKSGHFSDTSHWTKKKTQIEKDTEARKMFKLNAEGQAKLPLLKKVSNFGIAAEQALGEDTKETKCEIQREFYDVLENGANIIHPKISYRYKVDISQSSKSDIKEAKKIIDHMENFSGSYTEEKQIYDGLNNPLYAPKRVKKEKTSSSEQNPRGILDTLVPQDKDDTSDEISIDDLEMFTN